MLICCSINISDYYECWKTVVLLHNFVENVIPCEMWSVLGKIKKYKVIFFFNNVALNQRLWSEVTCGQVWWPILGIFGLHLTHPCAHTTMNTHPEQWAANAVAPGGHLGVRCLAQGSHLRHGIEGGESALYSLPPPTISAVPRLEPVTFRLQVRLSNHWAMTLGHNFLQTNLQIKLGWALFVTYTIIQSIMRSEMCSLHLTHPSVHLEQWAADCAAPGEQSWTSCRSRDSNPQPWVTSGFKSNALSIRPTTAQLL